MGSKGKKGYHGDKVYMKASHHMSQKKREEMLKRMKKAKRKARCCCFCKVFWILVLIAVVAVVISYVVLAFKGYNAYADNVIMQPIRARVLFEDDDNLKGKMEFSLFYQGKEDLSMRDIVAKVKSPRGNVIIETPIEELNFSNTIETMDFAVDISELAEGSASDELRDIRDRGLQAEWTVEFDGGPLEAMGIKSFKKASDALNKANIKLKTTGPYY